MQTKTLLAVLGGLSTMVMAHNATAGSSAGIFLSDGAGQGVQVEIGGPGTAPFFANAQGDDDGFSEFYAMRFDVTSAMTSFDSMFGAGNWAVDSISLSLTHAEASFSTSGNVGAFFSTDNSTALNSLTYANGIDGSNTLGGVLAGSWMFQAGNDGATFDYGLNDVNGLFSSIEGGNNVLTLTLEALDSFTAATYQGIGNFDGGEPVLTIHASQIPTPGTLSLLAVAGVTSFRRRR